MLCGGLNFIVEQAEISCVEFQIKFIPKFGEA